MTTAVAAVVVAAGAGERLGAEVPKALVSLAGRPLVAWAVEGLLEAGVERVVVVGPPDHLDQVRAAVGDAWSIDVVAGGATRSESVRAGLAALGPEVEVVAVHDAARARMPVDVIRSAVEAIAGDVLAAAPGLPVVDTIKRVGKDGTILGTVDRRGLWAVQTPQVFTRDVLVAIHGWAGARVATDDLALFEAALAAGAVRGRAVMVQGHPDGAKITHPHDLAAAEQALAHVEQDDA